MVEFDKIREDLYDIVATLIDKPWRWYGDIQMTTNGEWHYHTPDEEQVLSIDELEQIVNKLKELNHEAI